MNKKLGMTLVAVGAIVLAGCGATSSESSSVSSSQSSSSEAVDPALAKLQAAYDSLGGLLADPTNITTGFQVPVSLANNVTAAWSSAEPGVLSFSTTVTNNLINVTVNRPNKGDGDATFNIFADLEIAAELSAGNLTRRWTQQVTVKENTVEVVTINNIADILALRDPALDRTLNVTLSNMTIFAKSGGEAFAFDGTGVIQIYRGAAETLVVGQVYTISGLIDWYFGIWEIVESTAELQANATPLMPSKDVINQVLAKINRLTGEGAHLSASQNAAAGNFQPIYARITGRVAIIADRPANYNTYIMDVNTPDASFVAGAGDVPANGLLVYYQTVNYDLIKSYVGIVVTIDVVIYTFRSDQRAFAVYYVGGANGVTATLTDEQAQTIDAASLSLPSSITEATTLTLPAAGLNGTTIAWASSAPSVIDASTGVVTIPNPAQVVTLTATVSKGEATPVTRNFDIVVGQLENTTMAALLTKTAGQVAYSEAEVVYVASDRRSAVLADATGYGYIFNSVALDITLGQFIGANYTVGVFRGMIQMTAVKLLTPKGTDPNITVTPQVLNAAGAEAITIAAAWSPSFVTMELIGYASGNFTNGYLAGFGTKFVQTNGAPSTLRDKKFTVTGWITGRGSTTPAQSITLISTLNYDDVVAAATDPTDAEKLAISVERFVAPTPNNELTSNLSLPTTATFATVTWTSDTPAVISNTGVVTRPATGQPDATVKLSYVLTVGSSSSQPVEITFVVKAAEATPAPLTTDLLISEYIEGTPGNRKAIEIFNGTGAPVVLDGVYTLKINANANTTWSAAISLTGTIQSGDVYVVFNDDSAENSKFGSVGDLENTSLTFNGDDAIGLFKNDVLIDIFGVFGEDLGAGWNLGDLLNGNDTVDKIVVRKSTVLSPTTTWNRAEWEVVSAYVDANPIPSIGNHTVSNS
ncbi:MAG: immunoglobulin-like domain-containing protein [Bacilli bacterium]